jgi:membrane protease YdiL (CAAX protease family)
LAYRLYTRFIEKRPAYEISSPGLLKELGAGLAIGTGLILTMVTVLSVLGHFRIEGFSPSLAVLMDGLKNLAPPALMEELVFRAILFKLTEELLGSWSALIIGAGLFGFAHIGNENATVLSSFAILVSGGMLLGAAYMYTRRVWLVLGLHFAFNYVQGSVFGLPISGELSEGWIRPVLEGPEWLTGGAFGIEASVMTPVLCIVVGLVFLKKAINCGQVVRPAWVRQSRAETRETVSGESVQ